ncbi:MAG TPA: DUF6232 family protein [Chryseosolibacter sp.]|nr:DUF6232 family protein [Chryseosolibacter sp.]
MAEDRIIYTDGRDVTVTDSTLKVKNTSYRINGITRMCLWTIRPERWPGVVLMLLGLAALLVGWFVQLPADMNLTTQNGVIDANTLALWIGGGMFLIGLLVVALTRERYAVRITTAEGDKNALVSPRREYVAQIVDALNKAFNLGHGTTTYAGASGTTTTDYVTVKD